MNLNDKSINCLFLKGLLFPQQFVVECNDQRTEWDGSHEVSGDDVETVRVGSRCLLLQPVSKRRPVLLRQRAQRQLRVEGDVKSFSCQV